MAGWAPAGGREALYYLTRYSALLPSFSAKKLGTAVVERCTCFFFSPRCFLHFLGLPAPARACSRSTMLPISLFRRRIQNTFRTNLADQLIYRYRVLHIPIRYPFPQKNLACRHFFRPVCPFSSLFSFYPPSPFFLLSLLLALLYVRSLSTFLGIQLYSFLRFYYYSREFSAAERRPPSLCTRRPRSLARTSHI